MSTAKSQRIDLLGDPRAESDAAMLDAGAFVATPEFDTLVEATGHSVVVVGRRGTGKSALFKELVALRRSGEHNWLVVIDPTDIDIASLRSIAKSIEAGDTYRTLATVSKVFWAYALLMEIARKLLEAHAFKEQTGIGQLRNELRAWEKLGLTPLERTLNLMLSEEFLRSGVAVLNRKFALNSKVALVASSLEHLKHHRDIQIVVDRVDEGYQPDTMGVAIVNGLLQATDFLANCLPSLSSVVFLRDNILRSVAIADTDFTRNLEGSIIRLHWDENSLFTFIAKRIRLAGLSSEETPKRIWNSCTLQELAGHSGFKRVLMHTLYRPRDLIALLNSAFRASAKSNDKGRTRLTPQSVEFAAKEISSIRLEDLYKEYSAIVPGLRSLVETVAKCGRESNTTEVGRALDELRSSASEVSLRRTLCLHSRNADILSVLHSIGVFGILSPGDGSYTFCHDGKPHAQSFVGDIQTLVHPCYWRALDIIGSLAEHPEIHDEYKVEVTSIPLEMRRRKIKSLNDELGSIANGNGDLTKWFARALGILLAQGIRDLEKFEDDTLHGRITSDRHFWGDIKRGFGNRSLLFIVKNITHLEEARPITEAARRCDSASADYPIVFLCTRAEETVLRKSPALDAVKTAWHNRKVLVCHITAKRVARSLNRLGNPNSEHEPEKFIQNAVRQSYDLYIHFGRRTDPPLLAVGQPDSQNAGSGDG